jgi:hypothetical protein
MYSSRFESAHFQIVFNADEGLSGFSDVPCGADGEFELPEQPATSTIEIKTTRFFKSPPSKEFARIQNYPNPKVAARLISANAASALRDTRFTIRMTLHR